MARISFKEKEYEESVKKAKKSKRRRKAKRARKIFVCFLFVLIAAFCVLSLTVFFKTSEIKIEGNSTYTSEEIINISNIKNGDNLFLLNKDEISATLEKNLPFIKEAMIEIKLPETVVIKVSETEEQVCFKSGNKFFSADYDGKILKEYSEKPDALTIITVSDKNNFTTGNNAKLNSELEETVIYKFLGLINEFGANVNSINVLDPYQSYMRIDNRFIVKFGSVSELEYKAAYLKAMLKKMPDTQTGIIDLSVWSNGNQKAYFTEQSIVEYQELI